MTERLRPGPERFAVATAVWLLAALPSAVAAQSTRALLTVEVPSTINRERLLVAGFGGLGDVLRGWVSVGGEIDAAVYPGLFLRAGPFFQANVVRRGRSRLFLLGGYAIGENAGQRLGAGWEILPPPNHRTGFRAFVQRYESGEEGVNWSVGGGITWK
jgi:hypothetical protein